MHDGNVTPTRSSSRIVSSDSVRGPAASCWRAVLAALVIARSVMLGCQPPDASDNVTQTRVGSGTVLQEGDGSSYPYNGSDASGGGTRSGGSTDNGSDPNDVGGTGTGTGGDTTGGSGNTGGGTTGGGANTGGGTNTGGGNTGGTGGNTGGGNTGGGNAGGTGATSDPWLHTFSLTLVNVKTDQCNGACAGMRSNPGNLTMVKTSTGQYQANYADGSAVLKTASPTYLQFTEYSRAKSAPAGCNAWTNSDFTFGISDDQLTWYRWTQDFVVCPGQATSICLCDVQYAGRPVG